MIHCNLIRDVNYNVEYLDNYAVRVNGGVMNYEYFIDIRQRDILYLNKLYDGCKLRKPTKGYCKWYSKLISNIDK